MRLGLVFQFTIRIETKRRFLLPSVFHFGYGFTHLRKIAYILRIPNWTVLNCDIGRAVVHLRSRANTYWQPGGTLGNKRCLARRFAPPGGRKQRSRNDESARSGGEPKIGKG